MAFSAGIFYLVSKVLVTGTNVYAAILLIGFIVFGLLSLVFVILNESLKEKKAKAKPALNNELMEKKDTGRLLENKPLEPIPSVTENSTELLPIINKTRKIK